MTGRVVFDDDTLPVEAVGIVKVLLDGVEVHQGQITFAEPYALDVDVNGRRRVTLRFSIPEGVQPTLRLAHLVLTEATFIS